MSCPCLGAVFIVTHLLVVTEVGWRAALQPVGPCGIASPLACARRARWSAWMPNRACVTACLQTVSVRVVHVVPLCVPVPPSLALSIYV